jgi:hypothetical protein
MRFSNGKSLVGFVGGFFACMACTAAYFWRSHGPSLEMVGVSLVGGAAGATTELLCGRVLLSDGERKGGPIDIDDNLAVGFVAPTLDGIWGFGMLVVWSGFISFWVRGFDEHGFHGFRGGGLGVCGLGNRAVYWANFWSGRIIAWNAHNLKDWVEEWRVFERAGWLREEGSE